MRFQSVLTQLLSYLTRTGVNRRAAANLAVVISLLIFTAWPCPVGAQPEAPTESPTSPLSTEGNTLSEEGRIRELGERVEGLKEQVHESKSRMLLLKEQILHDVVAEAQVVLVHNNTLSAVFTLESVRYTLDGAQIYQQVGGEGGVLDKSRNFHLFTGTMTPGNHILAVEMVLRGEGGLFSYVDGYRFRIRSSHTFYAPPAKVSRIETVVFEKGGQLTTLEDRPAVRYDVVLKDADSVVPKATVGEVPPGPPGSNPE